MHIFFSGIGGTGIGPLAMIAAQAGYEVSGSDKQDSQYIHYLRQHGVRHITIGQTGAAIAAAHARLPIDWFVYTSALPIEQPHSPELAFCAEHGIKTSKRDELLNFILHEKHLKLIAVAGTHGKTTTTAMTVWAFQQLGVPVSYSIGAKTGFADMGHYAPGSAYFVYEADEYDRNFLSFTPYLAVVAGIDWDHPDIYPSREDYNAAFRDFLQQSDSAVLWRDDADRLQLPDESLRGYTVLDKDDAGISTQLQLAGLVNRQDAWLVAHALLRLTKQPLGTILKHLNGFPGVSRRFEEIVPGLYSDYAHTPAKIRGALQLGREVAGDNLVVVYEGLHNTRQHFIKLELEHLFDGVKRLYIVPSYLAREDETLPLLSPKDLHRLLSLETQQRATPSTMDDTLATAIRRHLQAGDAVLCLTAGGGGSLDEWLRATFDAAA
ncbi:MAG TPA: Mur ligase domain-containing protein [Candidatus Saccharimonadales bacterium]|nr:Mur ligase domain-containing protein [Candidatus Saccharimonadales bacterium]